MFFLEFSDFICAVCTLHKAFFSASVAT